MNENRRTFFRRILTETIGLTEEIRGRQQLRLSDLGGLPDDQLGELVPVLQQEALFRIEGNRLLIQTQSGGPFHEVFRLTARDLSIVDHMDGTTTLRQLSRKIATTFGFEHEEIYSRAKALFLALAKCGICRPANAGTSIIPPSHTETLP
jgi:hypothetical protein